MKHLEIKTIEHQGIKIIVKIDYDKETISLVENAGKNQGTNQYVPKQWSFANRGVDYMLGWVNILNAMTFAILAAKKDLQEFLDERAKEKERLLIKLSQIENEKKQSN